MKHCLPPSCYEELNNNKQYNYKIMQGLSLNGYYIALFQKYNELQTSTVLKHLSKHFVNLYLFSKSYTLIMFRTYFLNYWQLLANFMPLPRNSKALIHISKIFVLARYLVITCKITKQNKNYVQGILCNVTKYITSNY